MSSDLITKILLEAADSTDAADKILCERETGIADTNGRIQFLLNTFKMSMGSRSVDPNLTHDEILEEDYRALLTVIVNKKWR